MGGVIKSDRQTEKETAGLGERAVFETAQIVLFAADYFSSISFFDAVNFPAFSL
jgi:hypothetical protein